MASILIKLQARYGRGRVIDVFSGTGMEQQGRELNMGAYVVRNVIQIFLQTRYLESDTHFCCLFFFVCGVFVALACRHVAQLLSD